MIRYIVVDKVRAQSMGDDEGYMGSFSTIENAEFFAKQFGHLFKDPKQYYIQCVKHNEEASR